MLYFRVADGLCEGDELRLRETQTARETVLVQRTAEHAGQPFRGAIKIDILTNESDIGAGDPMLLLTRHAG